MKWRYRDLMAFGSTVFATPLGWPEGDDDLGAWTDVSADVRKASGGFSTGRSSRNSDSEPGTLSLKLRNGDGRYTPGFNASPYHPLTDGVPFLRQIEYPAGVWRNVWAGYVTDWDAGFEGNAAGIATASISQRLALPAFPAMKAILPAEILYDAPAAYWPLDDDEGAASAANIAGETPWGDGSSVKERPALTIGGSGAGALDFGAGGGTGADDVTSAAFTPNGANGQYLEYAWPTSAVPLQFELFFSTVDPSITQTLIVADISTVKSGQTPKILVWIEGSKIYCGSTVSPLAGPAVDARWHHLAVRLSSTLGVLRQRLWVDGVDYGYYEGGTGMGVADVLVGYSPHKGPFYGQIRDFAYWEEIGSAFAPSPARLVEHVAASKGFSGETADLRFRRLGRLAGIPDEWMSTAGSFTLPLAGQQIAGKQLSELWKQIENAEGGRLRCLAADSGRSWIGTQPEAGRLVFEARSLSWEPNLRLTLSADTDFNLSGSFGVSNDGLINEARGARPGGVEQTASNQESIERRGLASQSQEYPLLTDSDVLDVLSWLVGTRSEPGIRTPGIRLSGAKLHSLGLLEAALELEEGERVTLTDLPPGSPASRITAVVDRIQFDPGDDLVITLTLSPWQPVFTLEDAELGRLAGAGITLAGSLSASGMSATVAVAGAEPPLTSDPADLPLDIDINGERITVAAVTGAGPQTLTFSARGVAPTRAAAHSSGQAVAVWQPALVTA